MSIISVERQNWGNLSCKSHQPDTKTSNTPCIFLWNFSHLWSEVIISVRSLFHFKSPAGVEHCAFRYASLKVMLQQKVFHCWRQNIRNSTVKHSTLCFLFFPSWLQITMNHFWLQKTLWTAASVTWMQATCQVWKLNAHAVFSLLFLFR